MARRRTMLRTGCIRWWSHGHSDDTINIGGNDSGDDDEVSQPPKFVTGAGAGAGAASAIVAATTIKSTAVKATVGDRICVYGNSLRRLLPASFRCLLLLFVARDQLMGLEERCCSLG